MSKQPLCVLLHGLGKDRTIMEKLERRLLDEKFDVYNLSYPSRSYPIAQLAQQIAERINTGFPERSFYFVGHSLGNIVLRYIQAHHLIKNIERAVMLAPPNHGTPVVDFLRKFKSMVRYWGPAFVELSTDQLGIYNQLPEDINFECGIIAGNKTVDPWFSWTILKGENDGKVTVQSTKLAGMKAHIILPFAHPHAPQEPLVIEQTLRFLKTARFT